MFKMKTIQVTVSFSQTVEIQVDESRLNDQEYLAESRDLAVAEAACEINWRSGVVSDCEDAPELVE